jgi:hypothetical protein
MITLYLHEIWNSQQSNVKIVVLWTVKPCGLVDDYQRFEGHFNFKDGGGIFLRNVGNNLPNYLESHPIRPQSLYLRAFQKALFRTMHYTNHVFFVLAFGKQFQILNHCVPCCMLHILSVCVCPFIIIYSHSTNLSLQRNKGNLIKSVVFWVITRRGGGFF